LKPAWPRPEFLPRAPAAPPLAWAWAATGALVLAATLFDGWSVQQSIDTQHVRLAQLERRGAATAQPPVSSRSPALSDPDQARAAVRISAQLGYPWGELLATVESATPEGLRWLLLEHDDQSPDVHLEGLAPDVDTALQLVDALSRHPGWSDVVLSRLAAPDPRAPSPGAPAWRFEIHASVDAARVAAAPQAGGT